MKALVIGAAWVLASFGAAEAKGSFGPVSRPFIQKTYTLGAISMKPLAPAKIMQGWVLHNPYKPQSVKLTVLY